MRTLLHRTGRSTLPGLALAFAAGACVPDPSAEAPRGATSELGNVDVPTSCTDGVEADLERGVALLHHMMYVEAEDTFREAAERDPECAMAQWGLAMAHFQPFWGEHDLDGGRPHAERALELEAPTERERAYAEAVHAYYEAPDASLGERVRSWEAAMESLHADFPEDREAAAFFALAHLSTAPDDPATQERASRILDEVLEEEPRHPGAIHYAIHAHDVDARAEEGVAYARAYEDIAPSLPHALHMPSHIYVRVAAWDEVIEWNRRSADAALGFPTEEGLSLHYAHALDYLMYGYLQRGQDTQAEGVLEELRSGGSYQPAFGGAYALAAVPARWYVERRDWSGAADLEPRVPEDFPWDAFPESEAMSHFARGLGAARIGDLEGARAALDRLHELEDASREAWGDGYWASQIQVKRDAITGWAAMAEGRTDDAIEAMSRAAERHGQMEKHGVTPGDLQPAHELLGDLLMEADRPARALEAYETSLESWPGRYHTLLGAARAADALGEEERALRHYAAVAELTEVAEPGRAGIVEARERVAAMD